MNIRENNRFHENKRIDENIMTIFNLAFKIYKPEVCHLLISQLTFYFINKNFMPEYLQN